MWLNMEDLEQAHRRLGVRFSSTDEEVELHPMSPTFHVPVLPLCRTTKHPYTRYHTLHTLTHGGRGSSDKGSIPQGSFRGASGQSAGLL